MIYIRCQIQVEFQEKYFKYSVMIPNKAIYESVFGLLVKLFGWNLTN